MPTINSKSISARVDVELADRFKMLAESRGYTVAGLMTDFVERTVYQGLNLSEDIPDVPIPENVTRLYGEVLTLVDDLAEEGYPESEIRNAFNAIRREML